MPSQGQKRSRGYYKDITSLSHTANEDPRDSIHQSQRSDESIIAHKRVIDLSDLEQGQGLLKSGESTMEHDSIDMTVTNEKERSLSAERRILEHSDTELSHSIVRSEQHNDDCFVKLIWCGLHVSTVTIFIGADPTFSTFWENLTETLADKSLRTNGVIRFSNGQVKSSSKMAMSSDGLIVTEENWDQFRFSPVRLVSE